MRNLVLVGLVAACLLVTAVPSASATAAATGPCRVEWNPGEFGVSVYWIGVSFNDGADVDLGCLAAVEYRAPATRVLA